MTIPHGVDVPETLKAITRRLDDTQDLLEAAVQHLGTLETGSTATTTPSTTCTGTPPGS